MSEQKMQRRQGPKQPPPTWGGRFRYILRFIFFTQCVATLLSLGISALLARNRNLDSIFLPGSPFLSLLTHWQLTLAFIGGQLFFLALLGVVIHLLMRPTPTARLDLDRSRMIERLRYSYSEALEQILQGNTQLELSLVSIQNRTNETYQPLGEQRIFGSSSILQVYDEAQHTLLILGEPGAGKSTLLLSLAQHLVERAADDRSHPLPVVLPLSTWAVQRLPLQEWLNQQLSILYDVPGNVSWRWVQEKQVLPLLDGLDEMELSARIACTDAINSYHREHMQPIVVCSRAQEYDEPAMAETLVLQSSVMAQPLSSEQVEVLLVQGGEALNGLHAELRENAALAELARNPLMLRLLIATYRDAAEYTLPTEEAALRHHILTAFVRRVIGRKRDTGRTSPQSTIKWLGWLAHQMRERKQSIFYLEYLQPDWLAAKWRVFYRLSLGLALGLIVGLIGGVIEGLVVGLASGLFFGLFLWLTIEVVARKNASADKIQPAEAFMWSWRGVEASLVIGLPLMTLVSWLSGLLFSLPLGLLGESGFFAVMGLLGGFGTFGYSERRVTKRLQIIPNVGIYRAAQRGLFEVIVLGLGMVLVLDLVLGALRPNSSSDFSINLSIGLLFTMMNWIISMWRFGLGAVLQHIALRLWLSPLFPLNAVQFLENARRRNLMRRVGGGYSFAHRILLDYFADLYDNNADWEEIKSE